MSDLQQLLDDLAGADPYKHQVARSLLLRRLDLPAVAAGVARLLAHRDPEVRRVAAQVVCELGPVAGPALPTLANLLDDPEPAVRHQVCLALAALGEGASPRDVAEALMKAAHDKVYEVRKAAVAGLHRIGPLVPSSVGSIGRPELIDDSLGDESEGLESVPEWVTGLADQLLAHVTPRRSGYVFTLPVGENRLQRVRLSVNAARDTLCISTECGPLHPARYAWALEQNLHLYPGCLALRKETKRGRSDELVLLATVPLAEAFPSQVVELIRRLALQGDQFERTLTGRDNR